MISKKTVMPSKRKSVARVGATMPRSNAASGMNIAKPRIEKDAATTPGFKPTKRMKTKMY